LGKFTGETIKQKSTDSQSPTSYFCALPFPTVLAHDVQGESAGAPEWWLDSFCRPAITNLRLSVPLAVLPFDIVWLHKLRISAFAFLHLLQIASSLDSPPKQVTHAASLGCFLCLFFDIMDHDSDATNFRHTMKGRCARPRYAQQHGELHKVLARRLMISQACLRGSETSNDFFSSLHASLFLAMTIREQFHSTRDSEQGRKGGELDIPDNIHTLLLRGYPPTLSLS